MTGSPEAEYRSGPYPSPLPENGEAMVMGKDRDTARSLLAAAKQLGLDSNVVRTVNLGFIVPIAVWDQVQANNTADHGI